jgi:glutamine synthetase
MRYYDCRHLPQKGSIIAEYVWIDGSGTGMRSKSRTLMGAIQSIEQLPEWNYDGSSCYQAETENSEVIMKPVAFYPDPFRGGDNIIVLCSTYKWKNNDFQELVPANTNFRHFAEKIFE